MFSSEYWEIFKNNFLYRTPLVAVSEFLTKLAENNCKENHFKYVRAVSKTHSNIKMEPLQKYLTAPEVYSERIRKSKMELFV